jgi:2-succinyl-6-hydroxy-2,4-cyclohexadiene-1-carboxylate synthase
MAVQASLAVRLHSETGGTGPPDRRIVLLHGFTQTARCWAPVDADLGRDHEVVRIDAPGHGGSSDVRADLGEAARLIAEAGGPAVYVGYSMGARMALHVVLEQPSVVRGLVLIGGTPGIADAAERAERRRRDRALAQRVRAEGVEAFLELWLAQPLFAGLPPAGRFEDERRRNTADGLASSLELAGTGAQASRWDELAGIDVPTLVVAGAGDTRYAGIARRMVEAIGADARAALVPGAGHAAHVERPEAFLQILRAWLPK